MYADLDPFEAPALLGAHLQFAALIKFLGGLLATIGFLGPKLAPNIGIANWLWSLLGQAYRSEYRQVREISHSPIIGGNVPFAPPLKVPLPVQFVPVSSRYLTAMVTPA